MVCTPAIFGMVYRCHGFVAAARAGSAGPRDPRASLATAWKMWSFWRQLVQNGMKGKLNRNPQVFAGFCWFVGTIFLTSWLLDPAMSCGVQRMCLKHIQCVRWSGSLLVGGMGKNNSGNLQQEIYRPHPHIWIFWMVKTWHNDILKNDFLHMFTPQSSRWLL